MLTYSDKHFREQRWIYKGSWGGYLNRNKQMKNLSLQAVVWKYLIKQVVLLDNMYLISYIKFRYLSDSVTGVFGISLSPLSAGGSVLIISWEN